MIDDLKPVLSDDEWVVEQVIDDLPEELRQAHSKQWLAEEALNRLSAGYAEYLKILSGLFEKSGNALLSGVGSAYMVEVQGKNAEGLFPLTVYPVIPTKSGFCTFGIYYGTTFSPNTREEDLANFQGRVARLPRSFQEMYRAYERICLNRESKYTGVPDVTILSGMPYGSSPIGNFFLNANKRALRKKLGSLQDFVVIAWRNSESAGWVIFFDNSENGAGTIYFSPDRGFSHIFSIKDHRRVFDEMFEYYLLNKEGEFDFSRFLEEVS